VMILYAERDMIKEDHLLHISNLIENARLEKVMGCNHFTIPYQAATIELMTNFLEE
jgi:hypothetical protein